MSCHKCVLQEFDRDLDLLGLSDWSPKSTLQLSQQQQQCDHSLVSHRDHKHHTSSNQCSHSPQTNTYAPSLTNSRTSLQTVTNQSQTSQSSKPSIHVSSSRSVSRNTRRDNSLSTNDTKIETNSSSMLRNLTQRSPTTRSQTVRSVRTNSGLQSRTSTTTTTTPTHSPTSRLQTRLPAQSLTPNGNSHSKQSLSPNSRNSDNSVRQRITVKTTNSDNQTQHKSLSMTSPPTTTSATTTAILPEASISPEILFLVKEQAKSIATINALQKRVEQLERIVKLQNLNLNLLTNNNFNHNCNHNKISPEVSASSSSSPTSKQQLGVVNKQTLNTCKEGTHVSDDSGGEYSRATTTSDEDELSLLLDQIVRRAKQLNITNIGSQQQTVNWFANPCIGCDISTHTNT
ncbi:uncharacterized protein LOC128961235 [Oppia nitens]|uniref:uncharacterized protein LOC128961235 n=1 Tax=Oppia nitens TaxID=1686743 RepID=UPI0023DC0DD5|nr:uncharacterized protein LOC128961235 [Oppia nitens]